MDAAGAAAQPGGGAACAMAVRVCAPCHVCHVSDTSRVTGSDVELTRSPVGVLGVLGVSPHVPRVPCECISNGH